MIGLEAGEGLDDVPGQLLSDASEQLQSRLESVETVESNGVAMQVDDPHERSRIVRPPFTDPIFRLGPGSWLITPGEDPEISVRLAVALPNVMPMGGSGSTQLITTLRGQRREEFLAGILDASAVTAWLRSLRPIWHWPEDVDWTPVGGSGSPEFTELWFAPFGLDARRPPLMARSAFATGVSDDVNVTAAPSIQSAIDVMLNVQELEADRRAGSIRHATDTPPAPAALTLGELAQGLISRLDLLKSRTRLHGDCCRRRSQSPHESECGYRYLEARRIAC
jgi:hypothetical protein